MKSYLLSNLTTRYANAERPRFEADHACDWLLWEPGAWKPPGSQTVAFKAVPLTGPGPAGLTGKAAESLAIVLDRAATRATLGRDPGCDLVINDGTLSSVHLLFTRDEHGWSVEDAGSRNGATVNRQRLLPQQRVRLTDGTSIVAAQVVLTFHSPAGLWARLKT